ncbi:hypothetical protein [Massilia sp. TSP1-1-2]|uniref:hypothetical protein n=1 Tax=Massilia sp. TSP1-1-2 TaxID=2804649 RepID=UPI003CE9514F
MGQRIKQMPDLVFQLVDVVRRPVMAFVVLVIVVGSLRDLLLPLLWQVFFGLYGITPRRAGKNDGPLWLTGGL